MRRGCKRLDTSTQGEYTKSKAAYENLKDFNVSKRQSQILPLRPTLIRILDCFRDRYRDRLRTPLIGVCDIHHVSPARRFPPPWTVEELDACFVVTDSAGQKLFLCDARNSPNAGHKVT
jgi:hypothetical protein